MQQLALWLTWLTAGAIFTIPAPQLPSHTPPVVVLATVETSIDKAEQPLTLDFCVHQSLAEYPEFRSDWMNVIAREADLAGEKAEFHGQASLDIGHGRTREKQNATALTPETIRTTDSDTVTGSWRQSLHDSGEFGLEASFRQEQTTTTADRSTARVGINFSRPLLRGSGRMAILRLRRAELSRLRSLESLRAAAETLALQVSEAYWNLLEASGQLAARRQGLELALARLCEMEKRVQVGQAAPLDLAVLKAECADRRSSVQIAETTKIQAQLRLACLTGKPLDQAQKLNPVDAPDVSPAGGNLEELVATALENRSELREARIRLQDGDLEVKRTRNGLLPVMDLVFRAGRSGTGNSYADAFSGDITSGLDATATMNMDWEPGNRGPAADLARARADRESVRLALENLTCLIETDLRSTWADDQAAGPRLEAARETVRWREAALNAEAQRVTVGGSTPWEMARAERDLTDARLALITARIGACRIRHRLLQQTGMLLDRFGIALEETR